MPLLAVELNDAGLVVARATDAGIAVSAPSPGCALLSDGKVLTGATAAARARITPLYAQTRFWQQLGLDRLPWNAGDVQTQADLAFAHLSQLLADQPRNDDDGLLFAVPPGYSREQLGLLVGIGQETGRPVRGLVDLGVAACAAQVAAPHVLHLDLQQHQAVVTVLELARAEGALRRTRYEILPGAGLLALQQSLAETVATLFVRQTRFDPLHEAATEQGLFDALPGWIARLETSDELEAEIASGHHSYAVTLTRASLVEAVEPRLADLLRLVQASRPAGRAVELCVSALAASVPGLVERLSGLRDCRLTPLASGAAARGALECSNAILRAPEAVALVHRLPVGVPVLASAETTTAFEPLSPAATPTHVLHEGRAYPINDRALVLGAAAVEGRSLQLPSGTPGLSRRHCTLLARDGVVQVEDHSTYGTFVNDERVTGQLALAVGDRLRLGAPGVTLELIRVMPDDGTP
ncbi:MAG TPA: FHA domain-containing protein [Steroidobacteraceae bacterium]